ncbi:biotin/lipoate A/B protein ligase family protein [Phormidesmis sp. 146-35]
MQTWRLIPLIKASGRVQMAIDQWLLEQHHLGTHPPTLRFYTWSPAAISLGYHQRQFPDFWKQLTWQGAAIELVRRPSGGRAVLHQGDLTYAVITSGLSGRRMQDYQTICEFLIEGWRSLGVELHYGNAGSYIHNPNCFGTATVADLVLENGAKLIGSAQLRKDQTILQHGSMRLEPNLELNDRVFGSSLLPDLPIDLQSNSLISTATKALIQAARNCFGIEFEERSLTDAEWQAVNAIAFHHA